MLQQALLAASSNNATTGAKLVACLPADGHNQQSNVLLSASQLQLKQNLVSSAASLLSGSRTATNAPLSNASNGSLANMTHITPNINQLLPSNSDLQMLFHSITL